ncbi:MAG: TonB-dependent receptor [Azonexus sp.]|nr:TonB-dependent receptor [Azonexus sp.]
MSASLKPLAALLVALFAGNALADQATTLKAITVTATADGESERQAAVTQKTVLDRAEIEALGGLTVGEVIRKLPGIEAGAHSGDGGPSANARGMGRDAVQFLVDGERPSANARYALTTVGRLPSGELERVEILRGASAEHGGSAPVTVNLIMKKARPQNSTALKAAVGLRGDEPNGQFTLSQGGGDRGFSWIVPLTINHHAMPLEKATTRQQSSSGTRTLWQEEREASPYRLDEFIVSPRLTWRDGEGSLSLWPSLYHNRGERRSEFSRDAYADPAAGTGLAADGSRREREESQLTIARLRAEGERKTGLGKLSGRIAVMGTRREQDTDRTRIDAVGNSTSGREEIRRDERELSSAIRLDRSLGDGLLSAGIEQSWHRREESQRTTGSSIYAGDFDASAKQWTAWLQHEWQVAKALMLTGGLRGEHVALEADGRQRTASQLAPSLAGRFEFAPDLILRSSIGAGLKAPKLEEISALTMRGAGFNSPLEADRGGNPNLQAERNINWELALDKHLPKEAGIVGANVYVRRTEDFIERRSALEGSRWVDRPYNEGTARHWGVEFDAKLKGDAFGWKGASIRSHLTLPKARVEDERLGLTRDARDLPRYQWSLGVDQALAAWQASTGFQFNLYGATKTDIPGELATRQKARTLLDLYVARRLTPQLNLRLEAQNVLGTDTRRLAGARSGNDNWSLATSERGQRSVMLSLEGKW